jgi:hypothetical protein
MPIILVIVGTWIILLVVMMCAFAIAHYTMSWSFIVYDLCSSSEGSFFYSVKIKTGKLPKEVVEGSKFVTLDLLGTSGQYVTRLVVPYDQSITNKAKVEQQDSLTITFKVGRKRRLPDIGRIRVDHELWHQNIFFHYIDIKSLNDEGGPRHFRANINKNVTMLPPAEVDVTKYQTDQVFKTEHDINYPGGRPTVHPNLTLPEGTMFFVFAVVLILTLSYCVPKVLDRNSGAETNWGQVAVNGVVAAINAIVVTLILLVLFKFILKRKRTTCGLSLTGRFVLVSVLLIVSLCLTFLTGFLADHKNVNAMDWLYAILIAAAILLLVGVPIGLLIEIASRRQAAGQVVPESTIQPQAGSAAGPPAASSAI